MSIYQHFRPEEKEFIDQALNWITQARTLYAPKLTDFLDPRAQQIAQTLLGNDEEISLHLFGGNDTVERKRAILCPDYFSPAESDFQIALFEITYPSKFVNIDHRQVLGTLMSLGLKREKYGDILISGEQVQFIAAGEIETYLLNNLEKIGKASVTLKKRALKDILQSKEEWVEHTFTVSSMRLDTIISTVINLSRQKAQVLISTGKVKMNFKQTENVSIECKEGDTLSIRGFGRCKIMSIEGKTKKDKWRITIGRL
ncbi:RNA-binding protein [Bacillus sp. V59.32b]|uniref:YlmH family RNA-binding protein n=1 Tax=Bacillus sp. V59.32b TaxID=1758642 RepID=UPI000E3D756C|nr:RNA-binding protein [Bacillus sp. V59.32b]RFU68784.1 RNA-binding protein [Bacillus sp. V59.32b]